jgi:exonuclease SbcC
MITKIKLKNWRSHLDSELNFSEGTNCFVGPMGAGKTSIMDAVCFGLFGTFLQLQQKKMKLEDIIMKKPKKKEQSEVTVFFDIDGSEWTVKRTITKGRSTAELRRNGELIEGPQTSKVTSEVEKILKMDYDLFTRAVYSEQNQLDMFLTIPKGQRMKKIDELLAIDKFEKARKNTKVLIRRCSTVSNERQRMVENLEMDESLKKFEHVKREMLDLKTREEQMKKQLTKVSNKKTKIARDVSYLKEQQRKLQTIEEDLKKFNALIDVTERDLEKVKEDLMDEAEKTVDELNRDIIKLSEDIQNLQFHLNEERKNLDRLKELYAEDNAKIKLIETEKILDLESRVKELNDVIIKLKKNPLRKLMSELKRENKQLERNQIKLQKFLAKSSEIEDSIRELISAGSVCPICGNKLTPKKKTNLISNRRKKIIDLKKDINKIKPEINKIKASIKRLEKKIKTSERLQQHFEELKDSKRDFNILKDELKKLKSKTKVFETQKNMFEKNISLFEDKLKNLEERQEKFKRILSRREEANTKIERLKEYKRTLTLLGFEKEKLSGFSPSILEKSELEYQSILGLEREIQTNIENLSVIMEEKQKLMKEIESKKQMLEKYKLEIKKIEAISDQLQLLEDALLNTQEQLRKDFVSAVNQAMQSIWNELYPYKDIYNIRLGIEGGDYVLQLQDSTGWIPADGIASGGERSMACLALRIAFSLVLAPQLKWLVLDEPTHNLDNKAVDELAKILRERITNLVDQVFLITHDPSLETAVSGYLYRLERDKARDGITKVTPVAGPEN